MDLWSALLDILILLLAAHVLGVVCEYLRQSPILGYLAAGTLLGPNALGLVSKADEVNALAELGVALLLFTIGLEFSWHRLRRLGGAAFVGGIAQVVVTMGVGAACSLAFGLSGPAALAIGAIVALSSTACVLRLLVSRAEIESMHGRHALGILLVQDAAVVPLVLLVSMLGGEGTFSESVIEALKTIAWAGVLVGVFFVLFNYVVPRVLGLDSLRRNRDLPILLAIVTGLGSAWGSHQLGLSPALGAFVAGMLLAASPFSTQIRADVAAIRTLLVTLFFSSIGMVGDPIWFVQNLPSVAALVAAIVVGKALIIWIVLRVGGLPNTSALAAGICLGQVGEFSFVLAAASRGSVLSEHQFTLIVSATITTLFLTPYLVALAPRVSERFVTTMSRFGLLKPTGVGGEEPAVQGGDHVVIVGYGPAGQAVARTLERLADRVTIIELNPSLVRQAQQAGFTAHIGDAMHTEVLEHAGAQSASAVVVTIPDPASARVIVELLRAVAPSTHIIARARYHRYASELESGGAHDVIDEEQFVGARLAARLRNQLRSNAASSGNEP